jgi:hypothetical protein
MAPRIGPLQAQSSVDLGALSLTEPWTAQVGFWLNHPGYGGVNLDNDPNRLSWAEFNAGQQRLLARYPFDVSLQQGVQRLHQVFALRAQPLSKPSSWKDVLGVELGQGVPSAGPSRAHGGLTIGTPPGSSGVARLALPFPTERPHQKVDLSSLQIHLVDVNGQKIEGAIQSSKVLPSLANAPEKSILALEIDRAKLPAQAFLRWSVDTTISDQQLDLSVPLPLSKYSKLPKAVKEWTSSAPMIQIEHPKIQSMAASARAGASTIQDLVAKTLGEIAKIRKQDFSSWPPSFQNDAASFATTGWGECTAHANLFAALMRANGVPCRVVNGIQRGAGHGQNMHYQNEYWVPAKGWVHVEPQGVQIQSPRTDMVETGIVSHALEAKGRGFEHYEGVQELTMIGMEVDAENHPLAPEKRTLSLAGGLYVKNSNLGQWGAAEDIAIHGAT